MPYDELSRISPFMALTNDTPRVPIQRSLPSGLEGSLTETIYNPLWIQRISFNNRLQAPQNSVVPGFPILAPVLEEVRSPGDRELVESMAAVPPRCIAARQVTSRATNKIRKKPAKPKSRPFFGFSQILAANLFFFSTAHSSAQMSSAYLVMVGR